MLVQVVPLHSFKLAAELQHALPNNPHREGQNKYKATAADIFRSSPLARRPEVRTWRWEAAGETIR